MPSKPFVVGMMSPSLDPIGMKVSRSIHDLLPPADSLRISSSRREDRDVASSYACPWLLTALALDKRRELMMVRVTAIPIMITLNADTNTKEAPLLDFRSDEFILISSPVGKPYYSNDISAFQPLYFITFGHIFVNICII